MNISDQTVRALNEIYIFTFYDEFANECTKELASELRIEVPVDYSEYLGKSIKATKKETTLEYILNKINTNVIYQSFANDFNKIVSNYGLNAYPTTYGIGVFVALDWRNNIAETKEQINNILSGMNVKYTTEYSGAGWVFRYKISKSSENINLIKNLNMQAS